MRGGPILLSLLQSMQTNILVPRGRASFGQHKESRPLA